MSTGGESGFDKPSEKVAPPAAYSEIGSGARMDSCIEGFLLFDENLNCAGVNSTVERLFRLSEKDVIGKNILEVVPCLDKAGAGSEYLSVMIGGGSSVANSDFGDLRLNIKAFKVGSGLGVILSEVTEGQKAENEGYPIEQRLDLAGKLAALGELTASLAQELNTLAGEQVALEKTSGGCRSECGADMPDARATFHSREMSSYLREFNKAMSQFMGSEGMVNLEEEYWQIARTLAAMAETREPYARGHSERVGLLANEIAIWLGCPAELIREIQLAAILHDVGKVVIPDHILYKPGELTLAEYNEIKRHPAATVDIVSNLNYFDGTAPMIESHHEWYNGSGYPGKLKEDRIHVGARILAVADAYDAMTSPRPHRSPLTNGDAIHILSDGAGKQWDPMIVHAFLDILGPARETLPAAVDQSGGEERGSTMPQVVSTQRGSGPSAAPSKAEPVARGPNDKAAEALERAEHWARWMECSDDGEKANQG